MPSCEEHMKEMESPQRNYQPHHHCFMQMEGIKSPMSDRSQSRRRLVERLERVDDFARPCSAQSHGRRQKGRHLALRRLQDAAGRRAHRRRRQSAAPPRRTPRGERQRKRKERKTTRLSADVRALAQAGGTAIRGAREVSVASVSDVFDAIVERQRPTTGRDLPFALVFEKWLNRCRALDDQK